jgi:hypothetical protein
MANATAQSCNVSMDPVTIVACVACAIVFGVSLVGVVIYTRATEPRRPQSDPNLLAYLASRGLANPPASDPSPPSLAGLYPGVVFGTCGDIAFALTVSTYRSDTTTAIYASRLRARVGTWWSAPRGQTFLVAPREPIVSTSDARYDAVIETYARGPDRPSAEVRARVLAFPGGLKSAGWYEGRAMVTMTTRKELEAARLDAAFDLLRALTAH